MNAKIRTTAYKSDMKTPVARLYQDNGSEWVEAMIDILELEPKVSDGQWAYAKHVTSEVIAEAEYRRRQWTSTITEFEIQDALDACEPIPMLAEVKFLHEIANVVASGEDIYVISMTCEDLQDGTR
jgi:hypothetical protein